MSIFRDFGSSARAQSAPATVGVVVALTAGFLAVWMTLPARWAEDWIFTTGAAWSKPWTLLSYPYIGNQGFVGLLFLCLWIWGMGASVEREIGSRAFLSVWLVFSAICALGLWVGSALLGRPAGLAGGWVPVAALTVVWGTRKASAQVVLMFVLPITGKWLAWLSAGLVFFSVTPPAMAPFAAAPLLLAYLYAANKLPFFAYSGAPRAMRGINAAGTRRVFKQEYYDEVKRREKSRAEKERLRKLFESSKADDPDEKD
jgi:membrane associated rhomboid family serine protease